LGATTVNDCVKQKEKNSRVMMCGAEIQPQVHVRDAVATGDVDVMISHINVSFVISLL
jgi:hypothetical protein